MARSMSDEPTRRAFVAAAGMGGALWLAGCHPGARDRDDEKAGDRSASGAAEKAKEGEDEDEISPSEDLMREHGLLDRVLLVYEEGLRRLDARQDVPPSALAGGAGIVRRFIEDYHEKLEEDYLFPRFEKANRLADLVATLRTQHQAGRRLTATIERLATAASLRDAAARAQLADAMRGFVRMYRPHAAREDTVLFPALRKVVSAHEYDALGEDFEKKEHELFGPDGFEKYVDEVATLEKSVGVDDLGRFTPA
jgi:hemerythrin-like domain-containing protein